VKCNTSQVPLLWVRVQGLGPIPMLRQHTRVQSAFHQVWWPPGRRTFCTAHLHTAYMCSGKNKRPAKSPELAASIGGTLKDSQPSSAGSTGQQVTADRTGHEVPEFTAKWRPPSEVHRCRTLTRQLRPLPVGGVPHPRRRMTLRNTASRPGGHLQ